jgi:arginase family enzyme
VTRAHVWLAQDSPDPDVLVIGVPWSEGSRCDLAPLAVRDRLHRFSTSAEEWGVDLSQVRVRDAGNWAVSELDEAAMVERVSHLATDLPDGPLRVFVGGDTAISVVGGAGDHVSVDLARLDRVFAPGAPGARPGGLLLEPLAKTVREAAANPFVVSFDFTGVDPELDRDGLTLDAMAYLMLSAVAGYADRER